MGEFFVYVAHDRSCDMYNMLIKEVYFPSRDGHVNLNIWVKYVGVLPKDVTKSQGYNEFTNAFFFFFNCARCIFFSYVWLYSYTLLTEYFLSIKSMSFTFFAFGCQIVLVLLYCCVLRVIWCDSVSYICSLFIFILQKLDEHVIFIR